MKLKYSFSKFGLGLALLAAFALSACGGSDGGSGDDTTTHTISGSISGLNGTLKLSLNGSDTVSVSQNGSFSFSTKVAQGADYEVTATAPGVQTCTMTNGSGSVSGDVTNVSVNCADKAMLRLWTSASGFEPYLSDGTLSGTVMLKDFSVGTGNSILGSHKNINGVMYFFMGAGEGHDLWRTEGTPETTSQVDTNVNNNSGVIGFNGNIYFTAYDASVGYELHKSDGVNAGTVVADINPATNNSYPKNFHVYGGALYFGANGPIDSVTDQYIGNELYKTDGTAEGTVLVADIVAPNTGTETVNSSNPDRFTEYNGDLYFQADGKLHKTDGTTTAAVDAGATWVPSQLFVHNSLLYMWDGWDGNLKYFDGSAMTTVLTDIGDPVYPSGDILPVGDKIFYNAPELEWGEGDTLWVIDSIGKGKSLETVGYPTGVSMLTAFGGKVYFFACDAGTVGCELHVSDGTVAGTKYIKDLNGTATDGFGGVILHALSNGLIYDGTTSAEGSEPTFTDGTAAGTVVLDVVPGSVGSMP